MGSRTKVSRRAFFKAAAVSGAAVATWPLIRTSAHAANPEYKMIFADTFAEATEKYVATGIDLFKELAERYSDGRLAVDIYRGGTLGGQTELPQKVQYGAVQACQVSMQNFVPYAEAYNVLDFPFLFPSNEAFQAFLSSPTFLKSSLISQPATKGLNVLVGLWANTGYRVFCTSKRAAREVRLPKDLKGLKVRITNSKVEQQAFKLTPASPVSVAWSETYLAMQQGTVDALNLGLGPLTANRIQEVVATATRLNMSFNAHVAVISKKWHDSLPQPVKDAIERAGRESWAQQQKLQEENNQRMWKEWESLGIKIIDLTPEERKKWIDEVGHQRPEWKPWKERFGMSLYEQIASLDKN